MTSVQIKKKPTIGDKTVREEREAARSLGEKSLGLCRPWEGSIELALPQPCRENQVSTNKIEGEE